jgi:hypothetical protein
MSFAVRLSLFDLLCIHESSPKLLLLCQEKSAPFSTEYVFNYISRHYYQVTHTFDSISEVAAEELDGLELTAPAKEYDF